MLVYRLCRKDEIDSIFKIKAYNEVGRECDINPKINTHNYDSSKKYLHFFKKRHALAYLYLREGRFICTYDIPDTILSETYGIGYYLDYINLERLDECEEYAIPTELVQIANLVEVSIITQEIDSEDYIDDSILNDSTRVIYERGTTKRLLYE